ncbi:MAG: hypothetical protein UE295_02120 [Acutalibacteraceae bacterium]|nr:hypothetical protein [Acutalibacteraceae bacterium]
MTIELLQLLSLISYILAGVLFLLSIALFFLLEIPKVIGILTGVTEKKSIESIRRQNETMDEEGSGNETSFISGKGNGLKTNQKNRNVSTEKISTTKLPANSDQTTVLNAGQSETTVLSNNETTVLGNSETTVLGTASQTTVLNNSSYANNTHSANNTYNRNVIQSASANAGNEFYVECELKFVGSSEIIA